MRKRPNEKLIEMLFTHFALRFLGDCGVSIYTPSSREEYADGYDASLMGASGFHELLLQFKAPQLLEKQGFSFTTTGHQHERLKEYPNDTAFYVVHTFSDTEEVREAQRDAESPGDFLRWYVAIRISCLQLKVHRFRYYAAGNGSLPRRIHFWQNKWGIGEGWITAGGWMSGEDLLNKFKAGKVGKRVHLEGTEKLRVAIPDLPLPNDQPWSMSHRKALDWSSKDKGKDFGVFFRNQFTCEM